MKKVSIAILAILYISTSVGATVNMHYCMGKLANWGFGEIKSKTCGKCGMKKSDQDNGCCKDEQKFIKNDTDQKTAKTDFQITQAPGVYIPVSFFEMPAVDISAITEENPVSNAPPRYSKVAVYIRNCVFLI